MLKQVAEVLTDFTPGPRGVFHIASPHYRVDADDETVHEKTENHYDGSDVTGSNLSRERDKHQNRGDES
jgi:hypothetical protein